MQTRHITFQSVKVRAEKRVKCAGCGKRLVRAKTFEQTINPWNRTTDGRPKTEYEVRGAVTQEAEAWKLAPECCADCEVS